MNALERFGNHPLDTEECGPFRRPVAARTGTVFLSGDNEGGNTFLFEERKMGLRDTVIHDAFIDNGALLFGIEGRRIILELLDVKQRIIRAINSLGFPFVEQF